MAGNKDAREGLRGIISECKGRALNEADTRHRIIDHVLHELLAWPRNRTSVEEYIAPGYVSVATFLDGLSRLQGHGS